MKRVLILTTSIGGGGAERNAALLSRFLNAKVFLAVYETKSHSYPHGGQLINLKIKPNRGVYKKIKSLFAQRRKLINLKRELNIDAVISFLDPPNFLNLVAKNNRKSIVTIRNFKTLKDVEISTRIERIQNWLLTKLYNKADKVVVLTQEMKEDMILNYNVNQERLKVIPNGTDIDAIQAAMVESIPDFMNSLFGNKVLVTVGKLLPQKGHVSLIRIFHGIKEKLLKSKLIIIGQGQLETALIKLASSLGLRCYTPEMINKGIPVADYDVFFLGFQSNPFKYIARSSVFILPSLFEGFPNVIIEAMACKCPIVSSDCKSGPREIIAPGKNNGEIISYPYFAPYGVLMPVLTKVESECVGLTKNEQLWVEALVSMLTDNAVLQKLSKASNCRSEVYSIINTIKMWNCILDS